MSSEIHKRGVRRGGKIPRGGL